MDDDSVMSQTRTFGRVVGLLDLMLTLCLSVYIYWTTDISEDQAQMMRWVLMSLGILPLLSISPTDVPAQPALDWCFVTLTVFSAVCRGVALTTAIPLTPFSDVMAVVFSCFIPLVIVWVISRQDRNSPLERLLRRNTSSVKIA